MHSRDGVIKEFVRPYYLKWVYFHLAKKNCPPPFRRCWDYPEARLGPDAKAFLPRQNHLPDVVILPMVDWHGPVQRTQHLVQALAALGHRCIYMNIHLGREFPRPYPFSERLLLTSLGPGIVELHVHLPSEPVFHHRCLRPAEERTIVESISAVLDLFESREQLLITSFPLWGGAARKLRATRGSPIVYDCHDLIEGFDNIDAELCTAEQDSIDTADLAVFSSDWLAQEHMARNPAIAEKAAVIRNGVTPGDFRTVGGRGDLRKETPTIGYVGALNWWFDAEMVATAARSHPEWRFLLVGPVASSFPRATFAGLPNVQLVGEVSYQELPHWLRQFDAGIIPFHLEPLTLATNPVKLYEYLACGFPIVSTALPEVERYGHLVNVAYNSQDFVRQLETCLSENNPQLAAQRQQAAARETWSARGEALEVEFARLSQKEDGDDPLNPDKAAAHGAAPGAHDRKIETLGRA